METIELTVHQFLDEMHRVGYGPDRLKTAASILEGLCAYHTTANFHYLDKQLTERYIDSLREMLDYSPTGQRYAQEQIVIIKIFLGFVDSGKITEIRYTLPRIPVPVEFAIVIDEYIKETDDTPGH